MHHDELCWRLVTSLDPTLQCGVVLWGDWWNTAALEGILSRRGVGTPWRAFPRGPGGALVVDDPFNAAGLFLKAFPHSPYGDFAGLWVNRYDLDSPFSLACTRWGAGWQPMPQLDLNLMATRHPDGLGLLAGYGTTPFVVGDTAHARMADLASFQADGSTEQSTCSTP
jgi:hypothetical protein